MKFSQGEIQNILGEFKIAINGSGNNYIEIKQVLKKYVKHFEVVIWGLMDWGINPENAIRLGWAIKKFSF